MSVRRHSKKRYFHSKFDVDGGTVTGLASMPGGTFPKSFFFNCFAD